MVSRTASAYYSLPVTLNAILNDGSPSIVIVCCSRADFLRQLSEARNMDQERAAKEGSKYEPGYTRGLLPTPSLYHLAVARNLPVFFPPSIMHLRAGLSEVLYKGSWGLQAASKVTTKTKSLIIINPLNMHKQSEEFSVQGLSKTFALAVEASASRLLNLRILDTTPMGVTLDQLKTIQSKTPWETRVPMLNGSVSLTTDQHENVATIPYVKILERFFEVDYRLYGMNCKKLDESGDRQVS